MSSPLDDRTRQLFHELVDHAPPAPEWGKVAATTNTFQHGAEVRRVGAWLAAGAAVVCGAVIAVALLSAGDSPESTLVITSNDTSALSSTVPTGTVLIAETLPPTASSSSLVADTEPSRPLDAGVAVSCVEEYSLSALSQRAFAFDGTVADIGAPLDVPLAEVTFDVHEWFAGDGPQRVTVAMLPPDVDTSVGTVEYSVGSRLLIAGEPGVGGAPLDAPVAWYCGFSRTYDSVTADAWREAFAADGSPGTATPTTSAVVDPSAFRPYVADPDVCVSSAAREGRVSYTADGLLRPFALSSAGWHRFQIIADPELGADGRWALVGTIPADSRFDSDVWDTTASGNRHVMTINGWPVAITSSPTGYTDAMIDLGGETDAYLRTYRFDLDSLRALIAGLELRPGVQPIGFDYSSVAELPGLSMVIDRDDTPVDADVAVLECVTDNGTVVRIGAISGDPLAQYVIVLDQPYPYDIGRIGEAVVSIGGFARRLDRPPTLSDVTNAPDDAWDRLLEQRLPSQGPVRTPD